MHKEPVYTTDYSSLLESVMIAAPCNVGWENMKGDDRVRFCGQCRLNVYNTSVMTPAEIGDLLSQEGSPCLRLFRRADGTMITENCPVGLRKIRDGYRKVARVVAAGWALLISVATSFAQSAAPLPEADSTVTIRRSDKRVIKEVALARRAACVRKFANAELHYKKAIAAIRQNNHDPKFIFTVYNEFADVLRRDGQESRALEIVAELKTILTQIGALSLVNDQQRAEYRRTHVLMGERHQKTSPMLPPGAPLPDKE